MARIEDIERRLLNWARWRMSGGGGAALGYAKMALGFDAYQGQRYRESKIPTSDCEAADTDSLVLRLPSELRATVVEVYLGRGGEADHMRVLCCQRTTMHDRIGRAHHMINGWLIDRDEAARAERARVDRLQAN